MRKGFIFIVIIFLITIMVSFITPRSIAQTNERRDVLYFYRLAILSNSRDSLTLYCLSQNTTDTIFKLPIYKFIENENAAIFKRLFDTLLLYDSYSSMTLSKNKCDDRIRLGVEFMDDSSYKTTKGVYLPEIRNKPLLIMDIEDTILTRLMLEKSSDSIVINVHYGDYVYWEIDSVELKVWFKIIDQTRCGIQGPYRNGIRILTNQVDTAMFNHFKWLLNLE